MLFGKKSERFIATDENQLNLFGEDQLIAEQQEAEAEQEEVTYKRTKAKKQPKRTVALPAHLTRKVEVIEPELKEGQVIVKEIGREITEILEYVPGQLYVKRYERPKYVVQEPQEALAQQASSEDDSSQADSNEESEATTIAIAELPTQVIPRGNAGASLLAFILTSKFIDHLPFYRQRMIFRRLDVEIAASTIGGWMNQSCQLLEGLYHLLVEQVQQSTYLQADESPLKVQDKHTKGATHQGYMWVYHDPVLKNVVFRYDPSRSQRVPADFFKGMNAFVQTDGYAGYNALERHENKQITLLACMAHARRKFEQAKENDRATAEEALLYFQQLYAIERQAREGNYSHKQRQELRAHKAEPLLEEFYKWLLDKRDQLLPKSKIALAVSYTLNLWSRLRKYTADGRYEIDNNFVENSIRPLALGRKNYLFAGSHNAAQRAAMMYSLFASCKANQINPYDWLKEVLELIPDHKANKLEELLPSSPCFSKFKLEK